MENNILPTAAEFLSDNINRVAFPHIDEKIEDYDPKIVTVIQCMEEYAILKAKFYVEAALKEASENAIAKADGGSMNTKDGNLYWTYGGNIGKVIINKDSIINSYPLDKIK